MNRAASIYSLEEPGIRDRWSELEKTSVIDTPFARLSYMEDLADILGLGIRASFVVDPDDDSQDLAGILVLVRRKAGFSQVAQAGFTPYSCIAARSLAKDADIHTHSSWLDALNQSLGSHLSKVDLILPPYVRDVRSFQWANWEASPLYTFQLSIDDPEQCLAGWSEGARRIFARSHERYHLASSQSSEHEIVRMCLASYDRHNKQPPLSSDKLEGLVLRQVRRRQAVCYTIHEDGKAAPGAGVAVLGDPPDAYYWVAGSEPGSAMTVLIGKLIAALSEQGFDRFDLVGANTPSIAEFKRRLNPELLTYFRVRHVRSRMLRIFLDLKRTLRR